MSLIILGKWLPLETSQGEMKAHQDVIRRFRCRCQFCGIETRLTPQSPLGHFRICLKDRRLPNEPLNWVPLCEVCSQFNDLKNLTGKGNFVEAGWISQSRLNAMLITSYGVCKTEQAGSWGKLKTASEDFLRSIEAIPDSWDQLEWDGDVAALEKRLQLQIHPFARDAYAQQLRFRFDYDAFIEPIQFWATQVYTQYTHLRGIQPSDPAVDDDNEH